MKGKLIITLTIDLDKCNEVAGYTAQAFKADAKDLAEELTSSFETELIACFSGNVEIKSLKAATTNIEILPSTINKR